MSESHQSDTMGLLAAALAKAQGAIKHASKDTLNANPHINKKYADLASVWDACRGPLAENGLAVVQRVTTEGDEVTVTTMLLHASGEYVSDSASARVAPIGAQQWVQALGLTVTYLRRYQLSALVGVAAANEDTDGEGASAEPAEPRGERPARPAGAAPTTFPPFGKMKGQPIQGAPVAELESYMNAARRSLADESKARFHAKEQALLNALMAEVERQRGAANEGKRETATAPAEPKKPTVVDQQPGESEDHAKQRAAGVFYAQAVKAGKDQGWEQEEVGKWLRKERNRGGKAEVTAEDVQAFLLHFEPPSQEPGANG